MSDITFAVPMNFSVSFATASKKERAFMMDRMEQLPERILTIPMHFGTTSTGMTNSLERIAPRMPRWQELNCQSPRRKRRR
jgi:hypothetical protein